MDHLEINPAGDFTAWHPSKIKDLKAKEISGDLGQKLLFENENVRIWEVLLLPNERLPFRQINLDYCWVAMTDGLAITRYADAKITLIRMEKGDSAFVKYGDNVPIHDLENIGEDILFLHMTEFKHYNLLTDSLTAKEIKVISPPDKKNS